MAIATPRTASSETPTLDPVRIFAFSGAIASNLIAAGLLLMPLQPPPPAAPPDATTVWIIPASPPAPVLPPPIAPPLPVTATPTPRVAPTPAPTFPSPAPIVVDQGTLPATAPVSTAEAGPVAAMPMAEGPAPVQLQYAAAPAPPYPRESLRNGDQGLVLLQVRVDVDGRPLEVLVVEGSGHRALDRAAQRHVLENWRFRPAIREGRAVQALGLVPIEFALD